MNYSDLIPIGVALAGIELVGGIALGWWLRGGSNAAAPVVATDEADHARDALTKLQELATSVAANVGEHSSRVQAISGELEHSTEGALDPAVLSTVTQIVQANERLQQQLASAEEKLQEQAEEIQIHLTVSLTDSLTGIANRRAFDIQLAQRFAEWKRRGTKVSLAMVDVDHFKAFNDTHGHLAGDEILQSVAQTLAGTMREMDIVARYGGEEFAVIMPSSDLFEAQQGAERARNTIAKQIFAVAGKSLQVTASVGVAQADADEDTAAWIGRADAALYFSKKSGRNRVSIHDGAAPRGMLSAPLAGRPAADLKRPEYTAPITPADESLGLPSRTAFCEQVRRTLVHSQSDGIPLALVLFKVDRYEELNKRYGEQLAHLVMKSITQFLNAAVREGDSLTRYDVGTFGILFPCTGAEEATAITQRLVAEIASHPVRSRDIDIRITTSHGLTCSLPSDDSTSLLYRAETTMNASYVAGGNCIHAHDGKQCRLVPQLSTADTVS